MAKKDRQRKICDEEAKDKGDDGTLLIDEAPLARASTRLNTMRRPIPYEKSDSSGSGGRMVARRERSGRFIVILYILEPGSLGPLSGHSIQ